LITSNKIDFIWQIDHLNNNLAAGRRQARGRKKIWSTVQKEARAKQNANAMLVRKEEPNAVKETAMVVRTKEDKNEALPNYRQGFISKFKSIV
jgi:hypothetical protein